MSWPVHAIHAAVLKTGEVLHYSFREAWVWNPRNSTFHDVSWRENLFCSGLAFLPKGTLYVTGGTADDVPPGCQLAAGLDVTHIFNPGSESWKQRGDMAEARWYPSNLALGDGRVMILSGLDEQCELSTSMEIYTPGKGLELVPGGERAVELYPRVHLLPSGEVAHVGPEADTHTFDVSTEQWTYVATNRRDRPRFESASFMMPGEPSQIMMCGGFDERGRPSQSCERIDFADPNPRWEKRARMRFRRGHADAVLLPDGKVLVVGGGKRGFFGHPIMNPELYDPQTNKWEVLPPLTYGRSYHSTTVLLPDGRVLAGGQNDSPEDGVVSGDFAEIYEPPYLFRGPRPVITGGAKSVPYGDSFKVETPEAEAIASVVLIRPGSTTHSVNTSQRYIALDFEQVGSEELQVTAPEHGNLAPPGYYMLFIVNGDGVPSVAKMLRLRP